MSTLTVFPTQHETHAGQYALATGQRAVHRLEVLEAVYGAGTRALLQRAGVRTGMRVADFGCGVGIVSRLLAAMVGPSGQVVGIDYSKDQVEQARTCAKERGLGNTLFVEADAMGTGLPFATFDLIYCRFLLLHLSLPESALREMRRLLRPGGILVCEDGDLTAAGSMPVSALHAFAELFGQLGPIRGVDYGISRRLYHMVLAEGFAEANIFIHQPAIATGEGKSLLELSVAEAGSGFVEEGLIGADELKDVVAKMHRATGDPKVLALMPPMTQVWAIKA